MRTLLAITLGLSLVACSDSTANGVVSTPFNGDLTHTAFESDGSVRFRMSEGSIRADGAFHASRISGDWMWVLPDSTSYSGTFTAIRRDP